ncbi:hypothetical protein FPSE5266_03429 [Fusarium pseudograminearum]|nr:hypothetical protein FPSE5266_03429 [Fusarium pseudograminearum]
MSDSTQLSDLDPAIGGGLTNFLRLPGEIRNTIYEFTLLDSLPIRPFFGRNFRISMALFRVSKTINQEATQFFYSHNVFDFSGYSLASQVFFLNQIGVRNASYIRHVIIDFPDFLDLPSNVALDEQSLGILESISTSCTGLSTLRTSLESTTFMEIVFSYPFEYNIATKALQLVDTHCRALPSRPEVILEVFGHAPSDSLRTVMETQGWTLKKETCPIED